MCIRDRLSPSQEFVCESCAEKLSFLHIRRELMAGPEKRKLICRAPFAYEGLVRDGILSFKFRGKEESFRGLSLLLAKELSKDACRWDIVTNVPVSSKRRRERGFDQSQRLAKETARNLHIPYEPLLVKHRDTRPQHTLSEEERDVYKRQDPQCAKCLMRDGGRLLPPMESGIPLWSRRTQ